MRPFFGIRQFVRIGATSLLLALGFGLMDEAAGQDFDSDWFSARPVTQTTRFGILPFFGYRFGGEAQDTDTDSTYRFEDSPAYGLIIDYAPMNYYGRFELLWSHQESSLDLRGNHGLGEVDLSIDVIQIGGEVEYGSDRVRGYVSAHVGATHFSFDDHRDETRFSFGIGGGAKVFLSKNVYLRGDLRGFCTVTDGEGSFIYDNGITVVTFSGSTLWQGQATAGVGITF